VVASIAANFPRHVERAELIRAGALGVVEAAWRFDSNRGVPFERFVATRIRGAVLDAVRADDWAPRSLRAAARRIEIVSTLKGIEISTQLRMSEVISQVLGRDSSMISVLTGPNLAREVILRQPAGAVAASTNQELADLTAKAFSAPYFRVYTSNDVIGCELASAAKNVIAIAVGMSIGMGFGENTQALVITRGLNELTRLAIARGAAPLTFVGLAGVGDLLATCGSPLSRNRTFGEALGRSGSVEQAQRAISSTAEGLTTAQALVELAHLVGVEAPIMEAVCDVVTSKISPQQAFLNLMKIHTGAEIDHV